MRVVFIDHVARLSGGEIALLRLLPTLARNLDVHVILGEPGPLAERLRAADISIEVLPLDPALRDLRKESVRPGALDLRPLLRLTPYVARLSTRLRTLRPDLVHTNSLKAALYGGVAARLAGIPVVWHVRDRIADDYLPVSAVRLVRAAARVIPAAVVANSYATLATLPQGVRVWVVKSAVVHDAVDMVPRPRTHTASSEDGFTVGMVGRIAPWKGQHVFLAAFARAFGGGTVTGRVIGSALFGESSYEKELRSHAVKLGIDRQIEFRGFREDVARELEQLDVLVHCSITPEPFGQVVLEGMAAGLPVVAAAAGGPGELISDGVDGILVPPGDVDALAAALRRLAADANLRARLGDSARGIRSHFTPEQATARLLDVYEAVLRSTRGGAREIPA
jgi:glycosyltransferase involved in cell wall biosynthesis